MFDLTGKIALVTGASGGIGAEIARAIHIQGGTVVLHGTRADKLKALAVELGARAHALPANLSDRTAVAGLVDEGRQEDRLPAVQIVYRWVTGLVGPERQIDRLVRYIAKKTGLVRTVL